MCVCLGGHWESALGVMDDNRPHCEQGQNNTWTIFSGQTNICRMAGGSVGSERDRGNKTRWKETPKKVVSWGQGQKLQAAQMLATAVLF